MDSNEQAELIRKFMIAIAPVVTIYTLETMRLFKQSYMALSEEAEKDVRLRIAHISSELTLEIASYMAARFAELHDAAQPTQKKDSASAEQETQAGKQAKKEPAT